MLDIECSCEEEGVPGGSAAMAGAMGTGTKESGSGVDTAAGGVESGGVEGGAAIGHSLDGGGEVPKGDEGAGVGGAMGTGTKES